MDNEDPSERDQEKPIVLVYLRSGEFLTDRKGYPPFEKLFKLARSLGLQYYDCIASTEPGRSVHCLSAKITDRRTLGEIRSLAQRRYKDKVLSIS